MVQCVYENQVSIIAKQMACIPDGFRVGFGVGFGLSFGLGFGLGFAFGVCFGGRFLLLLSTCAS